MLLEDKDELDDEDTGNERSHRARDGLVLRQKTGCENETGCLLLEPKPNMSSDAHQDEGGSLEGKQSSVLVDGGRQGAGRSGSIPSSAVLCVSTWMC